MTKFSIFNGEQARYVDGVIERPSKSEMVERNAAYVERANDNAGTYILDISGKEIGYVPNSQNENGIWLYYSSDVREWLGLEKAANAA